MRNILGILAILFCVAFVTDANAQMSKKEKKEWKKRIKKLTPEQYQTLLEENKSLKGQVSSLKKEVGGVDDKLKDKDDQIAQYQDQVSDLRSQVAAAKKEAASKPAPVQQSAAPVGGSIQTTSGVVFTVQIGAFAKKDLKKFAENNPAFQADSKDGLMKYTVGMFRDYWEADTFKKYLREIGVKDAFIASYKDGQRVPIKDVLEGVI
ncbi:MAG: Ezrin/radixin/moesin family protein [Cyclobacteriaceae bacterium]